MRKLTLAVVLLANVLTSAQAAELIAPPLSLERETAFGDICRPPPWYGGWSRMAPFVCSESLWWPRYYYLAAGMGPHRPHHYRYSQGTP
jgi:hypothetical protein